jgi:hypothetical protein
MRLALPLIAGVAVLTTGAVALSDDEREPAVERPVAQSADVAELPPLPKLRPKVVEPVAGGTRREAAPVDSGVDEAAPPPTARAPRHGGRDVTKATALANGVALPPLDGPRAVEQIIEAGNLIARAPYKWGGGHGKWLDTGYDCSGSVSFALAAAGLLDGPLASGPLMSWGEPGRGEWVTIWSSPGHVFMEVAGIRFDTTGREVTGSRWQNAMRSTAGFVARHPAGL